MRYLWISLIAWIIRKLGGRPDKKFYGKILCNTMNCGEVRNRFILKRFNKEDLIDIICRDSEGNVDWFLSFLIREKECERLHKLLESDYHTNKELNKALHMSDLEDKNRKLKEEVRNMQLKAEEFNNLLYATGLIVKCTGCESGRPFDSESLTEEKVMTVERISARLRSWWNNNRKNKSV